MVAVFQHALTATIGIAIPDPDFQSRDSGLALPGSRDPGSAHPFLNIGTLPALLAATMYRSLVYRLSLVAECRVILVICLYKSPLKLENIFVCVTQPGEDYYNAELRNPHDCFFQSAITCRPMYEQCKIMHRTCLRTEYLDFAVRCWP